MPSQQDKPHRHMGETGRLFYGPVLFLGFMGVLLILEAVYAQGLLLFTGGAMIFSVVVICLFAVSYLLWKVKSPPVTSGPVHTTLSHPPIPLPLMASLSIDPDAEIDDPNATDAEIKEALSRVPGTNHTGRMVSTEVIPMGGIDNDIISSPWAFQDGALYLEGDGAYVRVGKVITMFYELEPHSQSEFDTRLLKLLNTPRTGSMPGGFKLGPDGTQMYTRGRMYDEWYTFFSTDLTVRSIVLRSMGIGERIGDGGLTDRIFRNVDLELRRRNVELRDDPKHRDLLFDLIRTFLLEDHDLKFVCGQNFAGIEYYRTKTYALKAENNDIEANLSLSKKSNWELFGGITGLYNQAARRASKGRVTEEPYEHSVLEQSRPGRTE